MFTYLTLLLLLHLPLLLTASPTPLTPRFVESSPWQLRNLAIFTAKPGTPAASYLTFTFADTNPGLNMSTVCTRYVMAPSLTSLGSSGGSGDGGGSLADGAFYTCANSTVGWSFDGGRVSVSRRYSDLSVGPPPYDVVTAFGDAKANFSTTLSACGTLSRQGLLSVPITQLIAKE